jgi:hypothetical protein
MPSLVPVPRKMSSDCRAPSFSDAGEGTDWPGAPQEEAKERAGRFTRARHYVEQVRRHR